MYSIYIMVLLEKYRIKSNINRVPLKLVAMKCFSKFSLEEKNNY